MFKHILVPTDFGSSAEEAIDVAVEIAKKFGSHITLVHAFALPTYAYMEMVTVDIITPLQEAARSALDKAFASLKARHSASDAQLVFGVASFELLAAIDKCGADLVVMGTHGRKGVSRILLGSVAERLVRTSPVPVLTVRGRDET